MVAWNYRLSKSSVYLMSNYTHSRVTYFIVTPLAQALYLLEHLVSTFVGFIWKTCCCTERLTKTSRKMANCISQFVGDDLTRVPPPAAGLGLSAVLRRWEGVLLTHLGPRAAAAGPPPGRSSPVEAVSPPCGRAGPADAAGRRNVHLSPSPAEPAAPVLGPERCARPGDGHCHVLEPIFR